MQTGEVVRRAAFNLLDRIHGGRLNRLKEVNKREILRVSARNMKTEG